jgi:RecB family exonuclease
MLSGGPIAGDADGTVTIARSASAALAAEVSGSWFAEREDRETVLIAQDSDTQLLDHGLAAAGQPRGGRSRNSPHRGSLQILLLAFKIAWAPFDPRALLELLLFPTSPIARRAGHRLAALLEEAPGRGGTKWENAWSDILSEELAEAEGDSALIRKAHARVERWRTWAEPALVDPVLGLPIEEALAACDRTISWAGARYASEKQPLYRATMTLASDVRGALVALGRERLPRNLIERIVDQVLDAGHDNPNVQPEAATWRSVAHPGAIWGPVDAVVWWNFGATREGLQRQPWTAAEKAELLASGCTIDPPDLQSRAASAAWERAVINARSHLLFVASGLDSNEGDADHPLSHRLAPATGPLATKIRLEEALSSPTMILAGVELRRSLTERAELPARRTVWSTPAGYADRARDLVHSATSFESGLACQLMWALKHVARLRPGRSRSIPDANQLLGNLAHALANLIFLPGAPPSPEDAAERTRELLDVLITEMAAPLRLPEFAAQLADATERLPLAMAELARTLHANGLVVEASEKQVSASFAYALAVRGAVDLIARDRNGEHVVIDLKWTRNPKRRLDELKDGEAVQLATYGAMVAGEAGYKAGYFLLNQRQFATLERGGLIGRAVEGACGFSDTWTAVRTSWRLLGKAAAEGTLVACGAEDASDHLPQDMPIILEANCGWCDYQTLCRVRGLK